MNKHLLIILVTLFSFQSLFAQLPNGSQAPDFTLTDLNGTTHNLYADYLDQGYTVFLDFSAVWCGPCWSYHTSHALKTVYENHGPDGYPDVIAGTTNDVMVFFIEGQGGTLAELNGGGSSVGDWVTGTTYPIICTDPSVSGNTTAVATAYQTPYWPTVYQVCPDRTIKLIGQAQGLYSLVDACLPPPSQNDDARSFMDNSSGSGCSSVTPEITIQNYGLNSLTEVEITVSLNGTAQYTTIYNQTWSNASSSYVPLNLSSLELENVVLDPVDGLVNGDIIEIDVSLPNGVTDTDSSNNQTITFVVDLGFDNAYWDGLLSINVAGDAQNSWYLKKVSYNNTSSMYPSGTELAKGFGDPSSTVSNTLAPLEYNECYTLQSINGANIAYTVIDDHGQTILSGSASSVEDFDNFTTGDLVWTDIDEQEISSISVYPSPAKDKLYVKGEYDYLRIIDLLGKEVLYSKYAESINVSSLNNGLYLLEIIFSDKRYSQKIQIAR